MRFPSVRSPFLFAGEQKGQKLVQASAAEDGVFGSLLLFWYGGNAAWQACRRDAYGSSQCAAPSCLQVSSSGAVRPLCIGSATQLLLRCCWQVVVFLVWRARQSKCT
jgi:hypothetical protein